MRSSVIGMTPVDARRWKYGTTLPRLPITLPYRTTENRVGRTPIRELAPRDFPASDHVAVPDDGKARWASSRICVRGDEEFVAHELRGAVEIDGAGGLVRAQRDDPLNLAIKGRIDDVLCAVDVCLDG